MRLEGAERNIEEDTQTELAGIAEVQAMEMFWQKTVAVLDYIVLGIIYYMSLYSFIVCSVRAHSRTKF